MNPRTSMISATLLTTLLTQTSLAQFGPEPTAAVHLTHDDPDGIIWVGDTVTWTLLIAFENAEAAATGNMEILGNSDLGSSSSMWYGHTNGGNNGGLSNGAGIGFVSWTNSLYLEPWSGIPADHSNPYHVGSYTFTATKPGFLEYEFTRGIAESSFLRLDFSAFTSHEFVNPEEVAIYTDTLTIVPSPSSTLFMLPTTLLATRRRR